MGGEAVSGFAHTPHPNPLPACGERECSALTLSQRERESTALTFFQKARQLLLPLGEGRDEGFWAVMRGLVPRIHGEDRNTSSHDAFCRGSSLC